MYQQIRTYLLSNKLLIIVIILSASSATWNWYHPQIRTVSKTEYRDVEKEKVVDRIKLVNVPGPKEIVTIEKIKIVEKLVLPPSIADDPNKVITGNADIPPSDSGTSVVSVLDTVTGETQIIAKEKPLSLFGFISEPEAALRYGITSRGLQQAEVAARWQFLRVGHFRIGAYGEVTSQPEAKAMLEVGYRF